MAYGAVNSGQQIALPIQVKDGGTGADSAETARANLGLKNAALYDTSGSGDPRNKVAFIANDGVMEIGEHIDFHFADSGKDNDGRITAGQDSFVFTKPVGISSGGTGAKTSEEARANLGLSYGTAAGTVCQGNDARLSNARTPTAHGHSAGDITSGVFSVERGGTGSSSGRSNVTFVNRSLNALNIDTEYDYCYVAAFSDKAGCGGTFPGDSPGWVQIVNFYSVHFVFQLCQEISNSTTTKDRSSTMWMRQRYAPNGSDLWSDWVKIMDSRKIRSGTSDLVAGSSNLSDGELYLVYE